MASRGLINAVEQQKWLEPLAEKLQKAVTDAYESGGEGARKLKNFLHGTWMEHPLHPALTDIPLGAWSAAFVLDLIDAAKGEERYNQAADASIAIGLAGAGAAAVTGITDWQHTESNARRIGLAHAMLNSVATVLYGSSLMLRKRGSRSPGRGLAFLGYAISMTSGYLGGNLAYGQHIGVDHTAELPLPHDFVAVMPESDLPENTPTRAEANGMKFLLVRRADRIYALAEICSHLSGPLAEGKIEGDSIRCPWHGSRFDLADGHVVNGPATFPQPVFETRIRNGQVEVRAVPSDQ